MTPLEYLVIMTLPLLLVIPVWRRFRRAHLRPFLILWALGFLSDWVNIEVIGLYVPVEGFYPTEFLGVPGLELLFIATFPIRVVACYEIGRSIVRAQRR